MTEHDFCEHAVRLSSGGSYCDAFYPDTCPYPARFCFVKDRRDAASSVGKPVDTLWESLQKGLL
ncbi:hypothetical protein CUJ86_04520 [Methanofollis fontis]|uniref:Uncharacterized protein n=2 Tax=Methanofollis fontis TaxID=2052832 RepID=A0A483CXG0_9EURY|nr:hypothetical protein CUJ86_04520 [Methanofollis fontis]